jgi:hypothetical protein
MSSSKLDEARGRAEAIVARAESDDEFKQRLKADPAEVLRAEGMPDDAIGEFVHEAGLGEVDGYVFVTICTLTCILSDRTACLHATGRLA